MLTIVRFLLGFMLVFTALFLILLVLIQRGRGGGLAGAFGGSGGQSAFGTKAGDVFTKITVGVAAFWIILCILAINILGRQQSLFSGSLGSAVPEGVQAGPGDMPPAGTIPLDGAPAGAGAAPAVPAVPTAAGAAPAVPAVPPAADAAPAVPAVPPAAGAAPAPSN